MSLHQCKAASYHLCNCSISDRKEKKRTVRRLSPIHAFNWSDFLNLNSQPTGHQSGILAIAPKNRLREGKHRNAFNGVFPKCRWIQWQNHLSLKGLEPASFCVTDWDATTARARDRIFKLSPIHTSLIDQISWISLIELLLILNYGKTRMYCDFWDTIYFSDKGNKFRFENSPVFGEIDPCVHNFHRKIFLLFVICSVREKRNSPHPLEVRQKNWAITKTASIFSISLSMSFNNLAFTSIVDLQLTSCLWFRSKSSLTRAIAQPIISLLICSKFHISLLLAGLDLA